MSDVFLGTDGDLINAARRDAVPAAPAETVTSSAGAGVIGQSIGPYELLSVLGEGGMGTVYLAEQTQPVRRRVALKIIKLGMDTKSVIARFEAERQALAMMDHPNVAKVFDAGSTEQGRPYFVMEYVAGIPITEHCDRNRLNIRQRLELFIPVCEAIQHAHQKGIIHRDIKPSNVLVVAAGLEVAQSDSQNAGPLQSGFVKVIDFGVAKATAANLTEKTLFTEQGQLIGTPAYMSPEQAEMTAQDIDTRSDIYSLGVLLYELLTGSLPFDARTLRRMAFNEIQRIIRDVEPPKPSTRLSSLSSVTAMEAEGRQEHQPATAIAERRHSDPRSLIKSLRGDLDWIVMKCLEKDRARRYETANGLAMEIRRYLNDEPVIAGPPGAGYRIRKFVRRNRGAVIAASLVAIALILGIIGTSIGFARAVAASKAESEQRRVAQQEAARADREALEAKRQAQAAEDRRKETQKVADFQASQLKDFDIPTMGVHLRRKVLAEAAAAMKLEKRDEADIKTRVTDLEEELAGTNWTNIALDELDSNIFDRALKAVGEKFADQPLVKAQLLQTLADAMRDLGLLERASGPQTEALAIRRRELGDEDPGTLNSIGNMGELLRSLGKLDEAERYDREALEKKRRVLGDNHPDTLISISDLGHALWDHGKLAEAEPYFREALEKTRRVFGDKDQATLQSINNMGALLFDQAKLAEAEPYYREALEKNRRALGEEHPDTLNSISNLGALLQAQGKLAEAEPYYREALERIRRVLGDEHPNTLTAISNMGYLLWARGSLAEAEPYFREALAKQRRVLGNEHRATLLSINNMGALLHGQGKLTEAEPYWREAMEKRRHTLGDDNRETLVSINNMGLLLRAQGRLADAEPYVREALEKRRRVLGEEHPDTLQSINNMCMQLQAQGKLAEAEAYGRETLEKRRRILGDDHPNTLNSINNLAGLLKDQGKFAEAEPYYREALEKRRRVLGNEHPHTLTSMNDMGFILQAQGKPTEAEPFFHEALTGFQKNLGPDRWETANCEVGNALVLCDLSRYSEAETHLFTAEPVLRSAQGVPPAVHKRCFDSLAKLYDRWHAAEPGKGYDTKASEWRTKLVAWQATTQPATAQSSTTTSQPAASRPTAEPHSISSVPATKN